MSNLLRRRAQPEQHRWLSAITATLAILIVIGLGFIAYLLVEQRLVAVAGDGLARSAADVANTIDRILAEHALHVRTITQAPVLREAHSEKLSEYLRAVQAASPFYLWIGITDAGGRIRAATGSSGVGRDESRSPWYESLRLRQISDVHGVDVKGGGGGTISLGVPIEDAQGRFLGTLQVLIGLQTLQSVFDGARTASRMLQNATGSFEYRLLASDGSLLFDSGGHATDHPKLRRLELPSAVLSMSAAPGFVEEEHPWRHVPVVTGYAHVNGGQTFSGVQWGVLVSLDRNKIVGPLRKSVWGLVIGGSILAVSLLGALLMRSRMRKGAVSEREERGEKQAWLNAVGHTVGEGIIATDGRGRVRFLNQAAQSLTGWKEDEAQGKALPDVLTIIHEQTRRAEENPAARAAREGRMVHSIHPTRLIARDGTERPIEYRSMPIFAQAETLSGVVIAFKERSERRSPDMSRLRNEGSGDAVSEEPPDDPSLWHLVEQWVRAAEVNRVCVFENRLGEDGTRWASRRYEWIGLGAVVRTEWSQWFSWSLQAKGFSRWEDKLGAGEVLCGPVREFPDTEQAALASCGIRTILVMPVFVQQAWWGFIEFDRCLSEREWSETEIQGLMAAARSLSAAIGSRQAGEDLQRLLAQLDSTLELTADGLLVVDGLGNLISFNQRLITMWGIPDSATESRSIEQIMNWMMGQLSTPELLLRTASELDSQPESESYDILELNDGRVFERFSKPRREGHDYAGRVWSFHEVTDDRTVRCLSGCERASHPFRSDGGSYQVGASGRLWSAEKNLSK